MTRRGCSLRSFTTTVANCPSTSCRSGLGRVARMSSVSVCWLTCTSVKFHTPGCGYSLPVASFTRISILIKILEKRSEEHTSELQSPDHLVCRLLLEKKKKKK